MNNNNKLIIIIIIIIIIIMMIIIVIIIVIILIVIVVMKWRTRKMSSNAGLYELIHIKDMNTNICSDTCIHHATSDHSHLARNVKTHAITHTFIKMIHIHAKLC